MTFQADGTRKERRGNGDNKRKGAPRGNNRYSNAITEISELKKKLKVQKKKHKKTKKKYRRKTGEYSSSDDSDSDSD